MTDRYDKSREQDDYANWRSRYAGPRDERDFDYQGSPNPQRFHRSRQDKVVAGVCAGIADRFGWDVSLVRVATLIAFFATGGGMVLLGYIIAWMVVPYRPGSIAPLTEEDERFWRGVSDRPNVTFSNIRYKFRDLEDRLRSMEQTVTSEEWRLRREFRDLEGR